MLNYLFRYMKRSYLHVIGIKYSRTSTTELLLFKKKRFSLWGVNTHTWNLL